MKYIEIMLLLICINISFTMIDVMGLIPMGPNIDDSFTTAGTVDINEFGSNYRINKSDNINYEFMRQMEDSTYSKTILQTNIFQDTDFLTGTWILIEMIGKGLFFLGSTLNAFGIPAQMHFMFAIPIYFMYLLALFQVISGRNIEANK